MYHKCPYKGSKGNEIRVQRGHMMAEAEIVGPDHRATDAWGARSWRRQEGASWERPWEPGLDVGPLASRTGRGYTSVVLSHQCVVICPSGSKTLRPQLLDSLPHVWDGDYLGLPADPGAEQCPPRSCSLVDLAALLLKL